MGRVQEFEMGEQARSQDHRNDEARNMASAVARAYMGVWGLCSQWGPGAKPLVGGPGGLRLLKLTKFCRDKTEFVS